LGTGREKKEEEEEDTFPKRNASNLNHAGKGGKERILRELRRNGMLLTGVLWKWRGERDLESFVQHFLGDGHGCSTPEKRLSHAINGVKRL